MITKARSMDVPVVVSRTSPTAMSVRLARQWGMTLVGYARPPRLRVYAGPERLLFNRAPEDVTAPIMLNAITSIG
jgi:FdhD protein